MATLTELRSLQAESDTWNTRLIGHSDMNGRGDGMQVLKVGRYAYVAHLGTTDAALSILDCADPSSPRLVRQTQHPPKTHRHKVQIVGDVLIQNSEAATYYPSAPDDVPETGLKVFSIEDPTDPREIGFHPVPISGVHRIWYSEEPYAHIAAWVPNSNERAYQIVDLSEPSAPRMAGAWWVPGTDPEDEDRWEPLDPQLRFHVHGVIPHGDRAYVSCNGAGMAILDISNVAAPRFISRINWAPPYGGNAHTSLLLPGRGLVVEVCESVRNTLAEDGDKRIWLIDVREERQPVMISSFPAPVPPKGSPWSSYDERPLRFGPHNCHENRPGSFYSETRIYSTWFNAGLRITDISDSDRPTDVGYFVPPTPPGSEAPQINDLFVDADGLIYLTDRYTGGMYVVEYTGG